MKRLEDYCLFLVEIALSFIIGRLCVIYTQYRYPAEETCNPKCIKNFMLNSVSCLSKLGLNSMFYYASVYNFKLLDSWLY